MCVTEWVITAAETISTAALTVALVLAIARRRRLRPLPIALLALLITLPLAVALFNTLEWAGLFDRADVAESFLWPLVPVLWLFLFMTTLERDDRANLQTSYERLAESEARYRTLVENAQVAIAATDPDLHVTFWNRGCERLSGWTADEALGREIPFVVLPEKRDALRNEILDPLLRDGVWFGEYPVLRKDGSQFTAFLSLSRVVDASGRALCLLGIVTDITERIRLREQLMQAQKMEIMARLAGGVAHDFNNLLTGILGFAGLLRGELPPGDERAESVKQIEDAARRGTELVRQLMSVTHDKPARTEPVNLNEAVTQALPLIQRMFPRRVRLVTHLATDLWIIRADPTQIQQVLMNLAINAADAMPDGGELAITTENFECALAKTGASPLPAGPCVRLTVADTGRGIPPDVLPRIFEPFFTTKADRGGMGLGLSTVYAIARRHGGCVTCTSQPGQGATFQVVLPATP